MDDKKNIDESWKEAASQEKMIQSETPIISDSSSLENSQGNQVSSQQNYPEMNFLTYISSLVFQAVIFLGEIPNPVTNKVEKNLVQAKLIIDTIVLIKEKTQGNLTQEENEMLSGSLYELQMKYVEISQKETVQ